MIRISSLWSLEDIEDFYYINDSFKIVNIKTGLTKKATKSLKRGYWYYTLQTKDKKQKKIFVHKIIALAFINNGPYTLIEHLDDDKDNNSIENLKFSNHSSNAKNAFKNKKQIRIEKRFLVIDKLDNKYEGTAKEISSQSSIPISTIYYLVLNNKTTGKKVKYIQQLS